MNEQNTNEKVIFIDRDGVINVDLMGYVERPEDFRFEEGAIEALKLLYQDSYKMVIISNQAGVGDGKFSEDDFWSVHERMLELLKAENIEIFHSEFCLHGKEAGCDCRKPEIGLFLKAEKKVSFDKDTTYFIGDKLTDIQAGRDYGIKTAFVRTGHGKTDEVKFDDSLQPNLRADNLLEAVKLILETAPKA